MKTLLLGLVLGVSVVFVGAYFYFSLGFAPVATSAPPMPFEEKMAHMALHARIAKEAPSNVPLPADEAILVAGALLYREQCAVCHGLKGRPETATAKGMFPKPPQFFQGHGVLDDPVGETYWKAKNGIRLTGMPAYGSSLSDQQLWQVSLLLAHTGKLPPDAEKELSGSPAIGQSVSQN
jgi:mono/diheme cytochrome c family protein